MQVIQTRGYVSYTYKGLCELYKQRLGKLYKQKLCKLYKRWLCKLYKQRLCKLYKQRLCKLYKQGVMQVIQTRGYETDRDKGLRKLYEQSLWN